MVKDILKEFIIIHIWNSPIPREGDLIVDKTMDQERENLHHIKDILGLHPLHQPPDLQLKSDLSWHEYCSQLIKFDIMIG